jgi:NADPH:quinone reductase-like Zn-dependent oxidoreductase
MKPVHLHLPGPPVTDEPPARLVALADEVVDPLVSQCGITTTGDGHWALYVTVPADATVPIASVERRAAGFPVVYEAALDAPVRAGPARPGGAYK